MIGNMRIIFNLYFYNIQWICKRFVNGGENFHDNEFVFLHNSLSAAFVSSHSSSNVL